MIISHKWKYVFIELPHTGSSAVSKVLRKCYDGIAVLHKHATYDELLKVAKEEVAGYYVFSTIRNPLDKAVTRYFILRNDLDGISGKLRNAGPFVRWAKRYQIRRTHLIQKNKMTFSDYFLRHYRLPYDDWSVLDHEDFQFVMRFESLQHDFSEVLSEIGIPETHGLAHANQTPGRLPDFKSYYDDKAIVRAKKVFGPYMEKWSYEFPNEWGSVNVTRSVRMTIRVANVVRLVYWRNFRPSIYAVVRKRTNNLQGDYKRVPSRDAK